MKVLSVVGARPQFIKAAPVSKALRGAGHNEFLLHTGQHYDHGMSQVFFDEMGIREPDTNLGIGSGSHGRQTGQMLMGIENVLLVLGAEITEGKGSRVRFYLNGRKAVFHRPHPRKETIKAAVESVRDYLNKAGVNDDFG